MPREKELFALFRYLTQLEKFEGKQAKAYMLNPMGFSIPLTKEMIPKLMKKFGLEGDQK